MIDGVELTRDRWYADGLYLWQPKRGFRATTDAVLLAAAIPQGTKTAVELGSGVGAAALALACRLPHIAITAAENNPLMIQLLHRNIAENGYGERITPLKADIFDRHFGGAHKPHELAFFNPPYNDSASSLSPEISRRGAMAGDALAPWVEAAARNLGKRGRLLAIIRADRLDEMLASCTQINLGAVVVKPIHSYADRPAIRVLVLAQKARATPLTLLPPLVLREGDSLTDEMEGISHRYGTIDMLATKSHKRQNLGLKK